VSGLQPGSTPADEAAKARGEPRGSDRGLLAVSETGAVTRAPPGSRADETKSSATGQQPQQPQQPATVRTPVTADDEMESEPLPPPPPPPWTRTFRHPTRATVTLNEKSSDSEVEFLMRQGYVEDKQR
jgi:hypothetical protein